MEQILTEAIEYLQVASEDVAWERFSSFGVTELMIPKTSKEIKKYVLKIYNPLLTSNTKMRLIGLPAAEPVTSILDKNIFNGYETYYSKEKECLTVMKKVLNSNVRTFTGNIPKCSGCGIILNSLYLFHLENQERLTLAVNYSESLYKGFDVIFDEERITATGNVFVKKLTIKFNEELKKGTSK